MRVGLASALLAVASWLGLSTAAAQDNPWPARAAMDLQAIHDLIAADHPGPLIDPAFGSRLGEGLARALEQAEAVDNVAGYLYLLMAYANSLPDHHLAVWGARDNPDWNTVPRNPTLYPGFITAYRNGQFVVRDAPDGGPIWDGMQLVACAGAPIEELAASNLFSTLGRAEQPADWARFGALLLIDQGVVGFRRPHSCTLATGERSFDVQMQWREVSMQTLASAIQYATFGAPPALGARRLADNGLWVSLPSFLADAVPADAADAVRAALSAAGDAPYLVFDLRGNSGGNSILADSFAAAAFGEAWVAAHRSADAATRPADLIRASAGNLAHFGAARDASSGGTRSYFEAVAAAIDAAIAAGEPLAALGGGTGSAANPIPAPAYTGPVFLLTDGNAFSSTLLFMDLVLRHPNARHVGWPTRGHGLYGELRQEPLPSGWAWLGFSTKAFMARAGEDHGLVPADAWTGEIADTAALEDWIRGLAAGQ